MKKIMALLISGILLAAAVFPVAVAVNTADSRASKYITYAEVWLVDNGDGVISVCVDIRAAEKMSELGMKRIEIEKQISGSWSTAATISGTIRNGLLDTKVSVYDGFYDYDAVSGSKYRAVVTVYAKNAEGSDQRTYTTNTVIA